MEIGISLAGSPWRSLQIPLALHYLQTICQSSNYQCRLIFLRGDAVFIGLSSFAAEFKTLIEDYNIKVYLCSTAVETRQQFCKNLTLLPWMAVAGLGTWVAFDLAEDTLGLDFGTQVIKSGSYRQVLCHKHPLNQAFEEDLDLALAYATFDTPVDLELIGLASLIKQDQYIATDRAKKLASAGLYGVESITYKSERNWCNSPTKVITHDSLMSLNCDLLDSLSKDTQLEWLLKP